MISFTSTFEPEAKRGRVDHHLMPRSYLIGLGLALLLVLPPASLLAFPTSTVERDSPSSTEPQPPVYYINDDGSVVLQLCYNWSCATRKTVYFTQRDMASVREQMAMCSRNTTHERLQRIRIGIWQMETLAEKHLPVLANDEGENEKDRGLTGRTDCVDNSTNTRTYLHILMDLGEVDGWSMASPEIRNRFDVNTVHWTAVIRDETDGQPWSIDSWFRPNGHLPFVMPLSGWKQEHPGWQPPFDRHNPYPQYSHELCGNSAVTESDKANPSLQN
jgi:hypothetical protein